MEIASILADLHRHITRNNEKKEYETLGKRNESIGYS